MAPRYGLDGPGIESRWGEIFRTRHGTRSTVGWVGRSVM